MKRANELRVSQRNKTLVRLNSTSRTVTTNGLRGAPFSTRKCGKNPIPHFSAIRENKRLRETPRDFQRSIISERTTHRPLPFITRECLSGGQESSRESQVAGRWKDCSIVTSSTPIPQQQQRAPRQRKRGRQTRTIGIGQSFSTFASHQALY